MNLKQFMGMGGEKLQVRRGEEIYETEGIKTHSNREIKFYPVTNIERGDWVYSVASGDTVRVLNTHTLMHNQRPLP